MPEREIDLRSDTVTRPTPAMRRAMAEAEVGDDVYGEDPSVQRLEARAAELLGKPAALFVPTGTMANQIALLCHTRPGDEVLHGEDNHCVLYEAGAGAAWAGVQFRAVGRGGLFTAAQLEAALRPADVHYPPTSLVALENTHNRAGGRVFPQADVQAIAELARSRSLRVHLDGARIWNAAVASGKSPAELAAPADSVSACFSKGLGAPVGSVLAGSLELRARAHRFRKMLGGGMRQAGVLCAAASHALEHHQARLAEDHENAQRLARGLARLSGLSCETSAVETNIVCFDVHAGEAAELVARARARGVRLNAIGPRRLRAVTHLDVTAADIDEALQRLGALGDQD
jgi:threonine aldolase